MVARPHVRYAQGASYPRPANPCGGSEMTKPSLFVQYGHLGHTNDVEYLLN
jgi:hypothetical protein